MFESSLSLSISLCVFHVPFDWRMCFVCRILFVLSTFLRVFFPSLLLLLLCAAAADIEAEASPLVQCTFRSIIVTTQKHKPQIIGNSHSHNMCMQYNVVLLSQGICHTLYIYEYMTRSITMCALFFLTLKFICWPGTFSLCFFVFLCR